MKLKPVFQIIIFLIWPLLSFSQEVPRNFCITNEEKALFNLINTYRADHGLQPIPLSKSLCYVAKLHVRDLSENHPDTNSCNLNSWSDKGSWTPCCHSKLTPNPDCILNKPKELTKYKGQGHEVCYWETEALVPDTIMAFWASVPPASDLLLNKNKWAKKTWKAMGIGIFGNYACAWVGEEADTAKVPELCDENAGHGNIDIPAKGSNGIISSPTDRYYLIFGSYNTLGDAKNAAEKYKKDGFYQAKVIIKDDAYRVSLDDHASFQEAKDALARLGKEYQDAWIVKY